MYITLFLCLLGLASAQTTNVTLISSVEQDGRQAACPGEVVTFTCRVTDSGALQWIAEPFISQNDPVILSSFDSEGETRDPTPQIHIILDNISLASDPRLSNFISTLTVNDSTALNGTEIQCTNGIHTGMQMLILGSKFMHDMSITNKMLVTIKAGTW